MDLRLPVRPAPQLLSEDDCRTIRAEKLAAAKDKVCCDLQLDRSLVPAITFAVDSGSVKRSAIGPWGRA